MKIEIRTAIQNLQGAVDSYVRLRKIAEEYGPDGMEIAPIWNSVLDAEAAKVDRCVEDWNEARTRTRGSL